MSKEFDVLVIGAGLGGYIVTIHAGQLGLNVVCCEDNPYDDPKGESRLGGTCLNVGCIPSKALPASSEESENVNRHLADHGITVDDVKVDVAKMLKRKDDIVGKVTKGIEFLFRKNKVTLLRGHGKFVGKADAGYQVEIAGKTGTEVVTAKHVVITMGSKARHLPGVKVDNVTTADNEGVLKSVEVPKKLGVIGAGVIGLELGSVWHRLGAEVTILEALSSFLGVVDESVTREANKLLTKQGLKVNVGVKVGEIESLARGVKVNYTDAAGAAQVLECSKLIVSIGCVSNTNNLGLEAIGLTADRRGFIEVDDHCATKLPSLWAIDDVVRDPMLAHGAEDEGVAVAERIVGQKPYIDYNCIPWVIYTYPGIAWVGKTEQQFKAEGHETKAGQFPFLANGRALGMGASDDFVKVITDAKTDEILGVHIVAANASDLVVEAVVAMEFKAAVEDIGRICHPRPSMSEVARKAVLVIDKRQLNM